MKRSTILLVAAGALLLTPVAAAHVTINPQEVPAGSFSRFDVRVPNERDDADTVKVTVQLPEGLDFVSFQPKPGWTRSLELDGDRIAGVTWEGGTIAPGEFDEFGLSAKMPDGAAEPLVFPSVQTYSSGEVVRWIGPPDADEPAPRVTLGADGGAASTPAPAQATTSESDHGTLAKVALGVGAAGLLAGFAALGLGLSRRPRGA